MQGKFASTRGTLPAVALLAVAALLAGCSSAAAPSPGGTAPSPGGTATTVAAGPGPAMGSQPMFSGRCAAPRPTPLATRREGSHVWVQLVAEPATLPIAAGRCYHAWTFNGQVPGPVIRVRQGDLVTFTLVNRDPQMAHSIDFHAARTPWSVNYQPVLPGHSFTFSFQAGDPGVFLYHCGVAPVIEHIANGMYGAVIVDPKEGRAPAREFVLVEGEWYRSVDPDALETEAPAYTVFNGYADRYLSHPLQVRPGERVRLYVVNAGPSRFAYFHVIGAIFDRVEMDGNPANALQGASGAVVGPGGAAVFETRFPQAGRYLFVNHAFADASRGATGEIDVRPDAAPQPLMPLEEP
ncbi:MAG: multicopper oxidase domain-containing protein [Bacillota bacterium]|nr:multicopper oxidase domain-containing protein [Bacillota bacterium]